MEFKKIISVDSSQTSYYLAEPIIINYSEIFVKIKYWYPHINNDNKVVKELIINYNIISTGE